MIAAALILALGLRLISLNQSLWLDEAVQIWTSKLPLGRFFNQFLPTDFNPPLYYLITHYWVELFGNSETALRLTSVVFGLASIYLFYIILKKLLITNYQLLVTVFLFATAPLHIYYSQEGRMYSLAVFSALLVTWRFIEYIDSPSWLNSVFLGTSLVIMSLSHYLTLLTLPVFVAYLFSKKLLFHRKTGLSFLILAVVWLFYLPIFKSQLNVGTSIQSTAPVWGQIIGSASIKSAALLPVKFVIGRINIQPQWLYGILACLLVIIYWGSGLLAIKEKFSHKYLFLGLLFFPPLVGFLISFWLPVFSYFRFIFCLPFLYLLIGLSPVNSKLKYSLVILNLIFSSIYLFNPKFHRENWKGLAEWLNQQDQPEVYILNQVHFPLKYYYQGKIVSISPQLRYIDISIYHNRIYLVSYGLPIFDPEDKIRKRLRAEGLKLKAGESFRKVGIEIWEK